MPGQGDMEVQTMVDSGATANFIDLDFAKQCSIPQQQVKPPVLVEKIDGGPL